MKSIFLTYGEKKFSFSEKKIELPRGDGDFIVLKSSYDIYKLSRPSYINSQEKTKALPDMWGISPENGKSKPYFVTMTDDFCHWLFKLNVEKFLKKKFKTESEYMSFFNSLEKTDPLIRWWKSLMKGDRSHTNRFGSDTCYDPISGSGKGKEPMRFFQVITGHAVLKVKKRYGSKIGFECINYSKGYRQWNPDEHWWLFDEPLLSGRILIGKDSRGNPIWDEKALYPYPQFEPQRPILPIILPLDDIAFLNTELTKNLLPNDKTPNKYKVL